MGAMELISIETRDTEGASCPLQKGGLSPTLGRENWVKLTHCFFSLWLAQIKKKTIISEFD